MAAGANVKAVQRMLGHASAAMTLDVYAGLFGDDLDTVAINLDRGARTASADWMRTGGQIWASMPTRSSLPTEKPLLRGGGAGGARTHDRRIMSPLL